MATKLPSEKFQEAVGDVGRKLGDSFSGAFNNFCKSTGLGQYPAEYNPKLHGPYDPARYHGKPDTPFTQLKVSEIPAWIGRRNKSPLAIARGCSRGYWRWMHKYWHAKYITLAGPVQLCIGLMTFFYVLNYRQHHSPHKRYKHRW